MSKPVIVFDVDSTLLDFVRGFASWMETEGHAPHPDLHEAVQSHDSFFGDLYPTLGHDKGVAKYQEYAEQEAFACIPLLDGVNEALLALRKTYPQAKLLALSSMGQNTLAVERRRQNLASLPLDDFAALNFGELKVNRLQELGAQLFFDDHPDQVMAAANANIPAVLIDQPWNRRHSAPHRLKHWSQAPDLAAQLINIPALSK